MKTLPVDREIIEHSFNCTRYFFDQEMSRGEYLAEYIFDFTTYDSAVSELFAEKALEVCSAISAKKTSEYLQDPENYRWFLIMVNMPFFQGRLNWGTSIRMAYWKSEEQRLESLGLWRGDEQLLPVWFSQDEWLSFIALLVEFNGGQPKIQSEVSEAA